LRGGQGDVVHCLTFLHTPVPSQRGELN